MKSTTTTTGTRRASSDDRPFSEALRAACGEVWNEATRHRFVKEVAADTLPDDVFRHYLIQDHVFMDALTRLVARGVAAAPGMEQKRRFTRYLDVLTREEDDYFERSFDALDVDEHDRRMAAVGDVTFALEDLFRAAVEEYEYAPVVAALLPVEWVHLDWASWTKQEGAGSQRFWLQEWVDMHTTKDYSGFVNGLRQEMDRIGEDLDPVTRDRLMSRFVRAVELEAVFFTDAYAAMH